VAGVIANRSNSVVGLSNAFGLDHDWGPAVQAVCERFPGLAMVGYEHGSDLAAARAAGFVSVGPLRVWLRQERRAERESA